jgi:hypothetical protein
MQVLQTSIILKYKPLFAFLQRQAANVAQEVQRAYMGVARTYYETGFRRYSRSLGWIKVGELLVEVQILFTQIHRPEPQKKWTTLSVV